MIDTTNDEVELYRDEAGEWRWRRRDTGNGRLVSNGGRDMQTGRTQKRRLAHITPAS